MKIFVGLWCFLSLLYADHSEKFNKLIEDIRHLKKSQHLVIPTDPLVKPAKTMVLPQGNETNTSSVSVTRPLVLGGIVGKRAKIDQRWVSEGESIEGWRIERIETDKVILGQNKMTKTLFLRRANGNIQIIGR